MGIFERLGTLISSYLNDDDGFGPPGGNTGDPDLRAAYDELDEFLTGDEVRTKGPGYTGKREDAGRADNRGRDAVPVPEDLRADFAELGVPFGAGEKACRDAYKKLLKLHHPDRHAGHAGNMKKATEKTARLNAAYDRIEKWREDTGGGARTSG
jgi:DnaJ-domain-containing protein 1